MKHCRHCKQSYPVTDKHWLPYFDKRFGLFTYKCRIRRNYVRRGCPGTFEEYSEKFKKRKIPVDKKLKKRLYDKSRRQAYDTVFKERIKESNRKYHSSDKGKASIRRANKARVSVLSGLLASRIRSQINARIKSGNGAFRHLTYSPFQLKVHIENFFKEGMSWETRNKWDIDHIIPLKYKNPDGTYYWNQNDLADPTSETFKKAWDLSNLQPLWKLDNIKKSNKHVILSL